MTRFYQVQVGALGNAGISDRAGSFWLVCFSDATEIKQLYFVALLPDGTVVAYLQRVAQ
jgi:hypothetical protein